MYERRSAPFNATRISRWLSFATQNSQKRKSLDDSAHWLAALVVSLATERLVERGCVLTLASSHSPRHYKTKAIHRVMQESAKRMRKSAELVATTAGSAACSAKQEEIAATQPKR